MNSSLSLYSEQLRVGLIQTDLNNLAAWPSPKTGGFRMSPVEAKRAWEEFTDSMRRFSLSSSPDIVLAPELALPQDRIRQIENIAKDTGTIIITGLDYSVSTKARTVSNEALICIPQKRTGTAHYTSVISRRIGKCYPADTERKNIQTAGYSYKSDGVVWLFDSVKLGRFGIVVCYDLLDLERALLYRDQVHHLFVLAYNQDVQSFYHTAEALMRTVYCNVVICNTGYHGGSVAVAPYRETWLRTVYRHEGIRLYSNQIVSLPVRDLEVARSCGESKTFKSRPPGVGRVLNQVMIRFSI